MYSEEVCLGCISQIESIRTANDNLNVEVVEQINKSQELYMLTNFSHDSNEYLFKKTVEDRISEVSSWRWVLEDLTKRLNEAIGTLKYEQNALCVVIDRIENILEFNVKRGSKPGALCPNSDNVEGAILQEFNFLREQKKKFEKLVLELSRQIVFIEKTRNRMADDILNKEKALEIDKICASKDYSDTIVESCKRKRKKPHQGLGLTKHHYDVLCLKASNTIKKDISLLDLTGRGGECDCPWPANGVARIVASPDASPFTPPVPVARLGCPLSRWVRRSEFLKRAGLRALRTAAVTRHQVREARIQLSIDAQAHASRVDAILKRRLHSNQTKLEDLKWQRDEAVKDCRSLDEELLSTEKSLMDTLDKFRIVEARLAERAYRPGRELTKDDVNKKLTDELVQLKKVVKNLRRNMDRIISIQDKIRKAVAYMDLYAEDLRQIVRLDEERVQARNGLDSSGNTSTFQAQSAPTNYSNNQLTTIQEETDDDYPFDD